MNAHFKKSSHKQRNHHGNADRPNQPAMPSLYSEASESEIKPFFLNKVETLTDDSEDERSHSDASAAADSDRDDANGYQKWEQAGRMVEAAAEQWSSEADSPAFAEVRPPKRMKKYNAASDQRNGEGSSSKKKTGKDEATAVISSNAQKMMKNMGYKEGEGLGKHGQGRVAPVSASKQKGRRGLGLVIADVDRSSIKYDPSKEFTDVQENVEWLEGMYGIDLITSDLCCWIKVDKKKYILDDETNFCDPDVLKSVLICKSAFDKMSGEEMRRARSRANPYEMIKKGPFLNRAAMKMANMDHVFEYMFTNPIDEYGEPLVKPGELLYFADVCAGPGGFSEYVLFRKRWKAKGFGFTLKGDNDFKLADFYAGPCESFEPLYGECDDGDLYKSANIISFTRHVLANSDEKGVHFMMADGGFSVEGNENIQEIMSKRIYLCQFLVALSILRTNGHFVCKLFDIFTPFSVGLIYLMYHCFKKISIHKPSTSRPANSERYIICKWKYDNVDNIGDYMFQVNKEFDKYGEVSGEEINEIVPLNLIKEDLKFYNYIVTSNNVLGERQVNSLAKILEFSEDETLVEEKQQSLKRECMELWHVPIGARRGPAQDQPDTLCRTILSNNTNFLKQLPTNILSVRMDEVLYTIHDWHAVILGDNSKSTTFYLGVAHKKCYKFDRQSKKWVMLHDGGLELSPETLVYGEIVPELRGQSRGQRRVNVFHIIDGFTLGKVNISRLHYTERIARCALYAKALSRSSLYYVMPIKVKQVFELDCLEENAFCRMQEIVMKNSRERLAMPLVDSDSCNEFYIPTGIMFIKATKAPFRRFISKSTNKKYYWSPKDRNSKFDDKRTDECISDFKTSYEKSLTWFPNDEEENPFNMKMFVKELIFYIRSNKFTQKDEK